MTTLFLLSALALLTTLGLFLLDARIRELERRLPPRRLPPPPGSGNHLTTVFRRDATGRVT